MNEQLIIARQAKADKKEAKDEASQEKRIIFLENKLDYCQKENAILKLKLKELGADNTEILKNNAILEDLVEHLKKESNKDYKAETINLALQIKAISPKAYELLSINLNFPKKSYIENKFNESLSDMPKKITNISEIGDVINIWKDKFNIPKSIHIKACLAVDALYFKPDFKITIENCISGLFMNDNSNVFLPKNSFNHFSNSPSAFQLFIDLNWKKIIKAGFVFQIQPYQHQYKPFVVHIFPSANGKSSDEIIDKLYKIRDLCKNRRIYIKTFAFDGDNSYRQLHLNYFKSYINVLIYSNKFLNLQTKVMWVASDYFHLLKRLRYRLLSSILHAGFNINSVIISIDKIKSILKNVGNVVFCNEKYTKMHDKLPIELFRTENLVKLIQNQNFQAAAYWFPITTSMISILNVNIEPKFRTFLLECSLFFFVYYYKLFENENGDLRQRKYGDVKDVTFYTIEIVIEFCNTLYSHLQLMDEIDDYDFAANGTGPLEHKFGLARIKSHDINTLTRFITVISSLQATNENCIKKIVFLNEETQKIKGRYNSFGIWTRQTKSEVKNDEFDEELPYSPQIVALSFLIKAGFNYPTNWTLDVDEVVYWCTYFLNNFAEYSNPKIIKRKTLSINTFMYGTDNCKRAKTLITGKPISIPNRRVLNRQRRIQLFENMCLEKLGTNKATKYQLCEIVKFIRDNDDECDFSPNKKTKKDEIFNWIIDNLDKYFIVIDTYQEEEHIHHT